MSLFKDSFPSFVSTEIAKRQTIKEGNSILQASTITSRTAWIRLTSGVSISGDNGALAKAWVLQGGDNNFTNKVYSGYLSGDKGIRAIPGIISLNVDSISANGSLRKATINFTCWDVNQLNILEQLYMRPGFTVCVEWGWSHKVGDNKIFNPTYFGDKLLSIDSNDFKSKSLLDLYKEAYEYVINSNANYDVCLGKVSNYSWTARPDGGYDCVTTIITYGEILESLKINYVASSDINYKGLGFISPENVYYRSDEEPRPHYERSLFEGILYEMKMYSEKILGDGVNLVPTNNINKTYLPPDLNSNNQVLQDIAFQVNQSATSGSQKYYDIFTTSQIKNSDQFSDIQLPKDRKQNSYIRLGDLCELISDFIIPKGGNGDITRISTNTNSLNGLSTRIKINAYPVQLPMDLNICLFYPKLWIEGSSITGSLVTTPISIQPNSINLSLFNPQINFLQNIVSNPSKAIMDFYTTPSTSITLTKSKNEIDALNKKLAVFIELSTTQIIPISDFSNSQLLQSYSAFLGNTNKNWFVLSVDLNGGNPGTPNIRYLLMDNTKKILFDNYTNSIDPNNNGRAIDLGKNNLSNITINGSSQYWKNLWDNAIKEDSVNNINNLTQIVKTLFSPIKSYTFFVDDTYSSAFIDGIWVNMDYVLYLISNPNNNYNRKNELNFSSFFNSLLNGIQNSIGSINDLRIHVDPLDNIARIIDMDFVDNTAKNLTQIEIQNTKTIVKNYNLSSIIFPELSTMIAISAQTQSGKLGYGNQHLVAYNNNISDRLVNVKDVQVENSSVNKLNTLLSLLNTIASYYKSIT